MPRRQRQVAGFGIDLLEGQDRRPEARQLLHSLRTYMAGDTFSPAQPVEAQRLKDLLNPAL
jgi:hypothetical protein